MNVVVLADTHVMVGGSRELPDSVYLALDSADVILHAGDVLARGLLDELASYAPVHAVLGNNDDAELAASLPEVVELDLDGVALAMVHDSGPTAGRPRRMHRRFPDAQIVIYGHSHAPFDGEGVDGQILFNPGSPTQRRRQPLPTFGRLSIEAGRIEHRTIATI